MWVRWRSLLLKATWQELHVYGWDLDVFVVNAGCEVGGTGLRGTVMVAMIGLIGFRLQVLLRKGKS